MLGNIVRDNRGQTIIHWISINFEIDTLNPKYHSFTIHDQHKKNMNSTFVLINNTDNIVKLQRKYRHYSYSPNNPGFKRAMKRYEDYLLHQKTH